MKLRSISVRHCFGFGNSGAADLISPSGIVSILGRNSSGKSSLLAAVMNLSPEVDTPQDSPRFENFYSPGGERPLLWGEIAVEGALPTFNQVADAIGSYLSQRGVPRDFRESDQFSENLFECYEQLSPLLERAQSAGQISVYRYAKGDFYLTLPGETADDQDRRITQIKGVLSRLFKPNGDLNIGTSVFAVGMTVHRIYREVARYFIPPLFLFGERFQLTANLPDRIVPESAKSAVGLERYLHELLNPGSLEEFFSINDPDRRNELLVAFRASLSKLANLVNAGGSNPMVEFVLHEKDGLQLTTKVDGKKSFYRHLSENTKFLIGYNLATHSENLDPSVLLFDEPNTGFHPSAQLQLLNFLERLVDAGHQVILTTHSEHLLDVRHICGVRTMTADSQGLLKVENKPLSRSNSSKAALALQPLLNAIGQTYGGPFPLSKSSRAVLVEGITDLMHIRALARLSGRAIEPMLIPGRGESTLPTITALCIGQGLELKFIVDKGIASSTLREGYLVSKEAIFEVPPWKTHRSSGIEDLYSKEDFEELLRRADIPIIYPKISNVANSVYIKGAPKILVAQQAMNEDLDFLGAGTREAFLRVFDFIAAEGSWFCL